MKNVYDKKRKLVCDRVTFWQQSVFRVLMPVIPYCFYCTVTINTTMKEKIHKQDSKGLTMLVLGVYISVLKRTIEVH